MIEIIALCGFVVAAVLSVVAAVFKACRKVALWGLLVSCLGALVAVIKIYYPLNIARDYLNTPKTHSHLAQRATQGGMVLGAAVRNMAQLNNPYYTQLFNAVTPENNLKLEGVLTHLDTQTYDFSQSDEMVNAALEKGLAVRGHALVFGKASDLFKAPDLDAWLANYPEAERKQRLTHFMVTHIQTMLSHYSGRIHEWDVVNEVLDLFGNGKIEENVFYRYVGPDYIRIALNTARKADPAIKIIINEQLNNYTDARAEAFYQFTKALVDDGIPLDGIGIQGHNLYNLAPPASLKAYMQRFAALGLTVEITELEARLRLFKNEPDPYVAQGQFYAEVVQQCLQLAACKGVTFWGFADNISWMDDLFYLFPKPNEPYLLDSAGQMKPAVEALEAVFK